MISECNSCNVADNQLLEYLDVILSRHLTCIYFSSLLSLTTVFHILCLLFSHKNLSLLWLKHMPYYFKLY